MATFIDQNNGTDSQNRVESIHIVLFPPDWDGLDEDVAEIDDLWWPGFTEYPEQGIFGNSIRWNFIFKISS